MNPDDIPRAWILRLICPECQNPIVHPDYLDCSTCMRRIDEALHLLKAVKGIEF